MEKKARVCNVTRPTRNQNAIVNEMLRGNKNVSRNVAKKFVSLIYSTPVGHNQSDRQKKLSHVKTKRRHAIIQLQKKGRLSNYRSVVKHRLSTNTPYLPALPALTQPQSIPKQLREEEQHFAVPVGVEKGSTPTLK